MQALTITMHVTLGAYLLQYPVILAWTMLTRRAFGTPELRDLAALGVIRDAGDAFAASMSRAQFDRMRFIFGLSDRGEASGGANESDDEREGREMPR